MVCAQDAVAAACDRRIIFLANSATLIERRYNCLVNVAVSRMIPANHPSLSGHFPGAPIVPAVVILDEVLAALNESRADCHLTGIPAVKFLAPLRPEQPFTICLSSTNESENEINFRCQVNQQVIVEGQLQVCQSPD
jgi:3-hydroxyacyl-[acyl-carrier-protein] dehydratase